MLILSGNITFSSPQAHCWSITPRSPGKTASSEKSHCEFSLLKSGEARGFPSRGADGPPRHSRSTLLCEDNREDVSRPGSRPSRQSPRKAPWRPVPRERGGRGAGLDKTAGLRAQLSPSAAVWLLARHSNSRRWLPPLSDGGGDSYLPG